MSDAKTATRYHRWQLVLGTGGLLLAYGYLLAVLVSGTAQALGHWAESFTARWWIQILLSAVLLGLGDRLLTLPLTWVRGYWLPRRYGLLHQPFRAWAWERVKAALVAGPLVLGGLLTVYALLRTTPLWWLWAAGLFFVVYVVMATVLPLWIMPIFYKLAPLTDRALGDRLLALATRAGVPAVGVWVADQSRKSRTANAALVGLGRTRRIVLFDTLIKEFSPAEIESVLAHELGHHVHGDMRRGLLAQGLLTLVTLWVADHALRWGPSLWGYSATTAPASVPWLAVVLSTLGLLATPLANAFSRRIERQADDFALETIGDSTAFVGAMDRLASLNLAERRPGRFKEMLLYSHPSIERRIARARQRGLAGSPVVATAPP
jgi:Zn-dependent protease with chaperone function